MSGKPNAHRGYRIELCCQERNNTGKDTGLRVEKPCEVRIPEHYSEEKYKQEKCSVLANVRSNK